MAKLSDIYKLRVEMNKLQLQIRSLQQKGRSSKEIAAIVGVPEKSVRVIIKWIGRKVKVSRNDNG
jgi:DNA-binding CsgD family transcriptional regulator